MRYPLQDDAIDHADRAAVAAWLTSEPTPQLTMGPLVKEFEQRWAAWLGVSHAVACNSGSSANLLMYATLQQSDHKIGSKVIVPATGWVTTVTPALQLGFQPIMCATDPDTLGLDLNHLESLLKRHNPPIVTVVQVLGVPNQMDRLLALKERFGFILLEDGCAAVGSSWRGRHVGSFGDLATFSTYYGHQAPSIEGGLVFTRNDHYADVLRMLRSHGWGKDLAPATYQALLDRYGWDGHGQPFIFLRPGYNFRLTDLQAFLGLRQLDKLDWIIARRHQNHLGYRERLQDLLWVQQFDTTAVVASIHFLAVAKSAAERRMIYDALTANGIETRLFTAGNLSRHPFWFERYEQKIGGVADQLFTGGFFLPNYPALTNADLDCITSVVRQAVQRFRSQAEVSHASC